MPRPWKIAGLKKPKYKSQHLNNPRASRNPGRRDGFHWNGDGFLCPATVDGDLRDTGSADEPEVDFDAGEMITQDDMRESRHEVAILDIARHAKLKGVAKEFEVLEAPRRIIALDEDVFLESQTMEDDESEWEDIDEFDLEGAGPSKQHGRDDDYLLARRLQGEEDLIYVPKNPESRGGCGARRKAYADVLRDNPVKARD
ncbi:hypothetical protein C8R44DRAFT_825190 [Mycena epipterygia]|nr:hypothetical protein C8R44DRAFT_825190 [Mycena epipterygia]